MNKLLQMRRTACIICNRPFLLSTLLPTNVPSNIHLNMNKKIYSLKIEEQDHTQYYSL